MFEFRLFENHSGMLLTVLNGILKWASQNQVRHDMYNTISSFDASLARDPTNIVETKKQDGRMIGPSCLKSS